MSKKIVIIGGVAGGATAATRLRRLNETDQIILLEKGEYISFANCGLPYHVGGVIKERDNLLLQTVEGMHAQYDLDIRNFSEVTKINPETKSVTIYHHQTKETYEIIFVNDGSKDNTYNILVDLAKKDNRIKVIDFSRNFGQQAALLSGFSESKGQAVIDIDVDLQDRPEAILDMIEKDKGAELECQICGKKYKLTEEDLKECIEIKKNK